MDNTKIATVLYSYGRKVRTLWGRGVMRALFNAPACGMNQGCSVGITQPAA